MANSSASPRATIRERSSVLVAFDQVPRRDRPFPVVVQARQETTLEIDLASFGDH